MKTKRFIIIVFLVVLLVAVAYMRALFSHQEREADPASSSQSKTPPADLVSRTEMTRVVDSVRQACLDSLLQAQGLSSTGAAAASSALVDSLTTELTRLNSDLKSAEGRIKELDLGKTRQLEKLVHTFYSNEVAALPSDLSSYERSIAVKEIRGKALKYFGITADTLDRILARKK